MCAAVWSDFACGQMPGAGVGLGQIMREKVGSVEHISRFTPSTWQRPRRTLRWRTVQYSTARLGGSAARSLRCAARPYLTTSTTTDDLSARLDAVTRATPTTRPRAPPPGALGVRRGQRSDGRSSAHLRPSASPVLGAYAMFERQPPPNTAAPTRTPPVRQRRHDERDTAPARRARATPAGANGAAAVSHRAALSDAAPAAEMRELFSRYFFSSYFHGRYSTTDGHVATPNTPRTRPTEPAKATEDVP